MFVDLLGFFDLKLTSLETCFGSHVSKNVNSNSNSKRAQNHLKKYIKFYVKLIRINIKKNYLALNRYNIFIIAINIVKIKILYIFQLS